LVAKSSTFEYALPIFVGPNLHLIPYQESWGNEGYESAPVHRKSRPGDEGSFHGVREYSGFAPVRNIHWRLSARLNKVVLIERELDPVERAFILAAPPMPGSERGGEAFESTLDAVASVTRTFVERGGNVRVAGYFPEWRFLEVQTGTEWESEVIRFLTDAVDTRDVHVQDLGKNLSEILPKGSLVQMATTSESPETDYWSAAIEGMGYEVIARSLAERESSVRMLLETRARTSRHLLSESSI
jgi:hypothetical protein